MASLCPLTNIHGWWGSPVQQPSHKNHTEGEEPLGESALRRWAEHWPQICQHKGHWLLRQKLCVCEVFSHLHGTLIVCEWVVCCLQGWWIWEIFLSKIRISVAHLNAFRVDHILREKLIKLTISKQKTLRKKMGGVQCNRQRNVLDWQQQRTFKQGVGEKWVQTTCKCWNQSEYIPSQSLFYSFSWHQLVFKKKETPLFYFFPSFPPPPIIHHIVLCPRTNSSCK